MDSSYARSSLCPTTRSLPAPTDLAGAGVSSLAQRPPALRKKFPLTHLSLCVLLSSAYPFSACSNRQTFVQNSRKGTPTYFLFPHLLIVALTKKLYPLLFAGQLHTATARVVKRNDATDNEV